MIGGFDIDRPFVVLTIGDSMSSADLLIGRPGVQIYVHLLLMSFPSVPIPPIRLVLRPSGTNQPGGVGPTTAPRWRCPPAVEGELACRSTAVMATSQACALDVCAVSFITPPISPGFVPGECALSVREGYHLVGLHSTVVLVPTISQATLDDFAVAPEAHIEAAAELVDKYRNTIPLELAGFGQGEGAYVSCKGSVVGGLELLLLSCC